MSAEVKTLHMPFIKFLRSQGLPYIRARSDRQSTIAKGAHDFTVIFGHAPALCIEFKDKGSLTKDQKDWIDSCARAGVKVHVVRELSVAVELVNHFRQQREDHLPVPSEVRRQFFGVDWRETPNGWVKITKISPNADISDRAGKDGRA